MSGKNASTISGFLRQEMKENPENLDLEFLRDAGLLSEKAVNTLLKRKNLAGIDTRTDETSRRIYENETSQNIRKSIVNGNSSVMSHAKGVNSNRIEATGYDLLVRRVKPAAQQVLFKGPKGSGKSTKAVDLAKQLHSEFNGNLKVMTNIKGPDEHPDVRFGETMSEFLEFAKEDGEKVIIGDEFSTVANEWTAGKDVKQQFGRAINALRKSKAGSTRLFIIGHEHDTDISKVLRVQSDIVIQADGKVAENLIDKATIFEGWKAYKAGDDSFRVRGMRDIQQSSPWSFNDKYFAHFEFDLDNPEKQIERGRLVDNWREYQGDADEEEEDFETLKCRGEKKSGGDCGSLTSHESGFCIVHREQWDGDIDPRHE